MIPNITRGDRIGGVLAYLAGHGRSNEHEEPHLVAGAASIMVIYGDGVLDGATAAAVARDIDEPRRAFGVEVTQLHRATDPDTGAVVEERVGASVWHCSLSLAADEGQLSDEQWGTIAQQFVDRMGFTDLDGKATTRWVAVRHGLSTNGNDHIHLAVSLVREDGTKASTHNDRIHAQRIARELEQEHGLRALESRSIGLGERGIRPGEQEAAARRGATEIDAHRLERLVRGASAASLDEAEFVRRLRRVDVLVRPRFAVGRDDVVAGYSVALRPPRKEPAIWFGGGRLARDLTLPRLREGWRDHPDAALAAAAEWRAAARNPWRCRPVSPGRESTEPPPALWRQYALDLQQLRDQLRSVAPGDRATWAHVARDTAGAFAAWSARVEDVPGPLAAASRDLARTAHLHARDSGPRPADMPSVAGAAMMLIQVSQSRDRANADVVMLRLLAQLSKSIMDAHAANGDARRAEQLDRTLRDEYTRLRGEFEEREASYHLAGGEPTVPRVASLTEDQLLGPRLRRRASASGHSHQSAERGD